MLLCRQVHAGVLEIVCKVIEELKESWLQPLLTDTLPYVTEALESHHAEVENIAREVLTKMQDIMGDAVRDQLEV